MVLIEPEATANPMYTFVAIVILTELTKVQLTPSVDLYPDSVLPVRTTLTHTFGSMALPAFELDVPLPVLLLRCQRTALAGERPISAYFDPLVRLSRIIAPVISPLPVF